MKVRCERDGMEWETAIGDYPTGKGEKYIDCPKCFRRYFREPDGSWESDRKLTILIDDKKG